MEGETWRRAFEDEVMITRQAACERLLVERTRMFEFTFRLAIASGALCFEQVGTALRVGPLHIPLPAGLGPLVRARKWCERADEHRLRVAVEISTPLLGPVFTYRGALELDTVDP